MAKNIIGIINPKDEIPKEYIKLLLKMKSSMKFLEMVKIFLNIQDF